MARAKDALNGKQIAVLRWVNEGADPAVYPPGDFAHRISAKALATRGLVAVSGRGDSWTVSITTLGAERLAAAPPPGVRETKDERIAELLARVVAADGRLNIEADDQTNYHELLRDSLQHPARPQGKRLESRSSGKIFDNRIVEIFFVRHVLDTVKVRSVNVPERLAKKHPVTQAFLADKEWQMVSTNSLHRAACIYEALARAAEQAGFKAIPLSQKKHSQAEGSPEAAFLTIVARSRQYTIRIHEVPGKGGGRYPYETWTKAKRPPNWQLKRNWVFVPTGRLSLAYQGPSIPPNLLQAMDGKNVRLEDTLAEVLQLVDAASIEDEIIQGERDTALAERRVQWQTAMEVARNHHQNQQIREKIIAHAEQYAQSQRVAAYLQELELRQLDMPSHQQAIVERWLAKGRQLFDMGQHFENLEVLTFVPPRDYELQPFLDGWDTFPPVR